MGNYCCDLLGKPYVYAQMNLQKFIMDLHQQAHTLENTIKTFPKMEERYTNAQPANRLKVSVQRGQFYADFKAALAKFNASFEDPYFNKVSLFHAEIAKVLTQYKAKINNSRNLLTLKQLGVL